MSARRPQKIFRLNYISDDPNFGAFFQILGRPAEIKMAAAKETFFSARPGGLSLSPGPGNNINIQALPHNLRYGGMLMDLPFPLSIMPTTPFTPWPKQMFAPPLAPIMPTIITLAAVASSFVGV